MQGLLEALVEEEVADIGEEAMLLWKCGPSDTKTWACLYSKVCIDFISARYSF